MGVEGVLVGGGLELGPTASVLLPAGFPAMALWTGQYSHTLGPALCGRNVPARLKAASFLVLI